MSYHLSDNTAEFQRFFEALNTPDVRAETTNLIYVKNSHVDNAMAAVGLTWKDISRRVTALPKQRRGTFDFSGFLPENAPTTTRRGVVALENSSYADPGRMKVVQQLIPFIPPRNPAYVAWGDNVELISGVIISRDFFPLYVEGPSGNGKTEMVEQACARAQREYVRVQINPDTDEDDLIGGLRLIGDETVFVEGPIVAAMRNGSVCLIDEVDRGTNKIMCLQGIMEGKPYLVKKTGETVVPSRGFNIIATANTLGRGSDDGKYAAASIIDDAFLERFAVTLIQPYAPEKQEKLILLNHVKHYGLENIKFMNQIVDTLVTWANNVRTTYKANGIDDEISTRRLCHIIKTMRYMAGVKGDLDRNAVQACLNRYNEETRIALMDIYNAVRPAQYVEADASRAAGAKTGEELSDDLAAQLRRVQEAAKNKAAPF